MLKLIATSDPVNHQGIIALYSQVSTFCREHMLIALYIDMRPQAPSHIL